MSVAWVGAGIAAVGAVSGARASSKAASAQQQAAGDANALSQQQFERQTELQEPFRQSGLAATNELNMLLGLTPDVGSGPGGYAQNEANFNSDAYLAANPDVASGWDFNNATAYDHYSRYGRNEGRAYTPNQEATPEYQASRRNDPRFGSLMRDFSMQDYQEDPGLAFRREQGEQGLQRAAAAGGRMGSGRYLKDAMRFNSGLASQEYGKAFDRYQVNRSNKLNPLQSLMGAGQTSANALGQAGQNYASTAGQNILGAGDARAAGIMGGANALAGGLQSGWNNYSQQNLINKMQPSGYRYTVPDYPGAEY
jgi:hypothetical protein